MLEREIEEGGGYRETKRIESNLLMLVQCLGETKVVEEVEMYVPNDCCEESLREVIKELKRDPDDHPIVRQSLAEWRVL